MFESLKSEKSERDADLSSNHGVGGEIRTNIEAEENTGVKPPAGFICPKAIISTVPSGLAYLAKSTSQSILYSID